MAATMNRMKAIIMYNKSRNMRFLEKQRYINGWEVEGRRNKQLNVHKLEAYKQEEKQYSIRMIIV